MQRVKTLIKCCILLHLIWVCTVCQFIFLGSRLKLVNSSIFHIFQHSKNGSTTKPGSSDIKTEKEKYKYAKQKRDKKLRVLSFDVKPNRKSYTAAFKLDAIQEALKTSNMAAAKKVGTSEKNIRYWRKQEELLQTLNKTTRKARLRYLPKFPELEKRVRNWILLENQHFRGVTKFQIQEKAAEIAEEMKLYDFANSQSWFNRFIRRQKFSWNKSRNLPSNLPDVPRKTANFQDLIGQKLRELNIESSKIINVDEVPLTFDLTLSEQNREKTAENNDDSCQEKLHLSVVLAVTAAGDKMPLMLIFKRKTAPTGDFPKDVVIKFNEQVCFIMMVMMSYENIVLWVKISADDILKYISSFITNFPPTNKSHALAPLS